MRSRTDTGVKQLRFLFVLNMIVLNFLDEGRRTYWLCNIMCIGSIYLIGFKQYLLSIQSERGLFKAAYFPTDVVYNALQLVLVFMTDVTTPAHKRKRQNIWIQDL